MSIEEALEALKSETNVKFKDLLKICEIFFEGPKTKGSHHIFKTPWKGQPWVNIQKDGSKAKRYQVKQVYEALMKLKATQEKK
ncbi:MAG: hypothetical protein A2381_07320 [Bdellovibrionales bacterium RIFOXYB1_FULL_37_110]|nr:MAG: hypothetical protein A2181_04085 [Bdellovibrionales bacterium RIFOXYA1_FULL_38_20]OFZ52420.1 MAG: hypothetical protein A2417_00040 [Bdellovibrionales bacterium RIFOXYC1_FULL_37_79]OFZ59622.1 MAG: hypothetical protein A2381_07320 [Bdellovibrionales bacterium RIFOXYB1_FULL_37_110]OFZ62549.1 MAG: hypothetical protein A2577_11640 [Bdellovibrionales bacterium RIFOXYD1_FULL_36_51]